MHRAIRGRAGAIRGRGALALTAGVLGGVPVRWAPRSPWRPQGALDVNECPH